MREREEKKLKQREDIKERKAVIVVRGNGVVGEKECVRVCPFIFVVFLSRQA